MMERTRAALACYDAHEATHADIVGMDDQHLLAWLDEGDRLAANVAFAYARDTACVNVPAHAWRNGRPGPFVRAACASTS